MATKEGEKKSKAPETDAELSVNECKVLHAVVKWPTANDRILSKKIGLKMSTVTAIRNRLKRAGWFKTIRIPLLGRLGCEMMVVDCFRISPTAKPDDAAKAFREILEPLGSCVFACGDRFHLITIRYHTTFSDAFNAGNMLVDRFLEKGIIDRRPTVGAENIFPYAHSSMPNLFNFADIIRKLFKVDSAPVEEPDIPEPDSREQIRLSNIEKRVYLGLIANPDIVDNHVGKKIGVTRQSVTKIRKRFLGENLLDTVRIPNIRMLGTQILAFASYRLASGAGIAKRKKSMAWTLKEIPAFFYVTSDNSGVIMGVARDFDETQDISHKVLGVYYKEGFFDNEPVVTLLSIKDLKVIKDFDFIPIVKETLGIKDRPEAKKK